MLLIARKVSPLRPTKHLLSGIIKTLAASTSHIPYQNPYAASVASTKTFSSSSSSSTAPPPLQAPPLALIRGGCYDETRQSPPLSPLCPGCGVHMQDSDPKLPGYFSLPSSKSPDYHAHITRHGATDEVLAPLSLKTGLLQEERQRQEAAPAAAWQPADPKSIVCARCHSLRHYGQVKTAASENLLPDFDFDLMVGPKIASSAGSRSVVLLVVDASDFDGSFPRKVARMISRSIEEHSTAWKEGKPGNVPRMVLVVTKIDLLPSSTSPTGLEYWVRQRAREGGAIQLAAVHMVSAVRDWGIRNLVEHMRYMAGPRGSVWAVGAQNAGKSTLINAMGRFGASSHKASHLTEASVPGTTLGIIRVDGVLGETAKLFDTPGILHPYQLSTRLTREEQKLVHIGKELRPRTYRIKVGHSIHIAGLVRLDVEETSLDTIYVTVWASPLLPLHMGKMENTCKFVEEHFGRRLQPPIGEKRVAELGNWVGRVVNVCGQTWNVSSVDIAAAGLGWFSICLKGEAVLSVWTYDGVDVVLRSPLILERANTFEVAGFTVSKILSEADRALSKQKNNKRKKSSNEENASETVTQAKNEEANA